MQRVKDRSEERCLNGSRHIWQSSSISPKDSLHWDTTFKSLQLDSMDMVEMMMDMEEELGVDFDQNDMAELTTIGELADYIEKKLNEG